VSPVLTDKPRWRQVYDAVERNLAPRVEALVHTREFTHTTAGMARARRLVLDRVNGVAARLWHLVNLPAGTDVQRLRRQVGELDRQLRRLTLQLDREARQQD
jgi:hypothetical protein